MRKFVMPIMAAAFLAVAGTAAIPETANAASVSVGIHGNGWSAHFNDGDRNRGHRFNRRVNCEPVYRIQRHWTRHGWKRVRVHVGYDCGRIHRRHGHGPRHW
ncbi:MAG: hypothetical protein KDJ55_12170 [Rhodobiaceae bacterium]|nr:hypothetical protein [Rhodobiaceae bacterium]MCC0012468.1 hypothetical protein [Rhodobiaceae bacterium]MCC0051993.1 hypothetical protein [Rhodobiaceae bacterium]MCC0061675.1 hypothetical protein [Rhodobiaceae bacterium]